MVLDPKRAIMAGGLIFSICRNDDEPVSIPLLPNDGLDHVAAGRIEIGRRLIEK